MSRRKRKKSATNRTIIIREIHQDTRKSQFKWKLIGLAFTIITGLILPLLFQYQSASYQQAVINTLATIQTRQQVMYIATQAYGALTFFNGISEPQLIPAGLILTVDNGSSLEVVTDESAIIPASNAPYLGSITIRAHVVQPGDQGNIAAGTLYGMCCTSDESVTVLNIRAFRGGGEKRYPISNAQHMLNPNYNH